MSKTAWGVTILAAACTAAFAAVAAPPKDPPPAGFAIRGDVANGKKLFVVNCASCHGKHGLGNGLAGQALKPPPASFSDAKRFADVTDWELFVAVRDGGPAVKLSPAMPPWGPALTDKGVADVLAYVKTAFIEPALKTQGSHP